MVTGLLLALVAAVLSAIWILFTYSEPSVPMKPERQARRLVNLTIWWRRHKDELSKDAVIGVFLLLGALLWDSRLAARQDQLARDLATRTEVLENTRFVRQIAIAPDTADKPFAGLNLTEAQLRGLPLACRDLEIRSDCADFENAILINVDLFRSDVAGGNFYHANLTDAGLVDANLTRADLTGADLIDAVLIDARLIEATLSVADFTDADLTDADLTGAIVTRADFTRADLTRVDLTNADVSDSDLTATNLEDADLTGADLRAANLTDANLSGATLTGVCFDESTEWGDNTPPSTAECSKWL